MRPSAKTLLIALVAAKILLVSLFVHHLALDLIIPGTDAIASESEQSFVTMPDAGQEENTEERIDLGILTKKRAELETRERELAKREQDLEAIEREINEKIKTLSQLRDEMNAMAETETASGGRRLKHLIKVYAAMKPQQAAGLVEKLDMDLAVDLLSQMKGENVGSILSFVDIERAAKICEGLAAKN